MNFQEYQAKNQEISEKVSAAVQECNVDSAVKLLDEQQQIEAVWIAQSGFKKGVRMLIDGRTATIIEDPSTRDVINNGIIVCDVKFDDTRAIVRVGLKPNLDRLD